MMDVTKSDINLFMYDMWFYTNWSVAYSVSFGAMPLTNKSS